MAEQKPITASRFRRLISDELRRMASEPYSIDDDGNPLSRATKLAMVLWELALGNSSIIDGKLKTVAPAAWAIDTILERTEGKVTVVDDGDVGNLTPADRVREVAVSRLNSLAKTALRKSNESKTEDTGDGHQ